MPDNAGPWPGLETEPGTFTNFDYSEHTVRLSPEEELAQWWRAKAEAEIEAVVRKAIEYGARDLIVMGRELAAMAGREDNLSEAQFAELGCLMYLTGKLARATAAWAEGRMPSDDTYHDFGVYVRMIQRIREVGSWPGVEV